MDIHAAVRELRKALGWSQQQFATELGLSIRAVVNYEHNRVPNPKSLTRLEVLASQHEFPALAHEFARSLADQMSIGGITRGPISSRDNILRRAFERCVLEDGETVEAKRIVELLEPYTRRIRKEDELAWRKARKH